MKNIGHYVMVGLSAAFGWLFSYLKKVDWNEEQESPRRRPPRKHSVEPHFRVVDGEERRVRGYDRGDEAP